MATITVEVSVARGLHQVWKSWTEPAQIQRWNHASDDWECPYAENNLVVGGTFTARMSAKDGSAGFDFNGTYTDIIPLAKIAYTIEGGRQVVVTFEPLSPTATKVSETFDPETENTPDLQRAGWQSILNNFKKHVESQN